MTITFWKLISWSCWKGDSFSSLLLRNNWHFLHFRGIGNRISHMNTRIIPLITLYISTNNHCHLWTRLLDNYYLISKSEYIQRENSWLYFEIESPFEILREVCFSPKLNTNWDVSQLCPSSHLNWKPITRFC